MRTRSISILVPRWFESPLSRGNSKGARNGRFLILDRERDAHAKVAKSGKEYRGVGDDFGCCPAVAGHAYA